jgi:hypothetical protein
MTTTTEGLFKAGDVTFEKLHLLTQDGVELDLTQFLVELNIFEDIFSNAMKGTIVLVDSRNIINILGLKGEETLIVKLKTPSFDDTQVISKEFITYKISDRKVIRDNNTQMFTIHFVSPELLLDTALPLYDPFSGPVDKVIQYIFDEYIKLKTDFKILTNTQNSVKFISPGWSPFKCINWLTSKAITQWDNNNNLIFYESNKKFYLVSIDTLYENGASIGTYMISPANIDLATGKDVNRQMFIVKEAKMISSVDQIKNVVSGYLSNRLVHLDIYNKEYKLVDYEHTDYGYFEKSNNANKYFDTKLFRKNTIRNPASNIKFYPKNEKLFDNFSGNVNEKMDEIHGNRLSSMLEATNLKLNILVPGRTDIEAGMVLDFIFPDTTTRGNDDSSLDLYDTLYSGKYLISAIHHRINKLEHMMSMEIVKRRLGFEDE